MKHDSEKEPKKREVSLLGPPHAFTLEKLTGPVTDGKVEVN